jgi:hypothetical protein
MTVQALNVGKLRVEAETLENLNLLAQWRSIGAPGRGNIRLANPGPYGSRATVVPMVALDV